MGEMRKQMMPTTPPTSPNSFTRRAGDRKPIITCGGARITMVTEYDWRFDAFEETGQHLESTGCISLYAAVDRMRWACGWRQSNRK